MYQSYISRIRKRRAANDLPQVDTGNHNKATTQSRDTQLASLLQSLQTLADALNKVFQKEPEMPKSIWGKLRARTQKTVNLSLKIMLTVIIISILFSDSFGQNTVIIEPLTTNSELQTSGYNDQIIAALLADRISIIIRDARSIKIAREFTLPLSAKLPDVEVPAAHISIKNIVRYIQEFAPIRYIRKFLGFSPIQVNGEALLRGEKIRINLRVSRDIKGGSITEIKTFNGTLENIDSLLTEAGQYVLLYAEPYLLASYLYQNKKMDESLAQIQYCISHNPDEYAHLAYTLWGMVLIQQFNYDEAVAKLKKAITYEKPGEKRQDLAAAYNNLGLALLYKHDTEGAIDNFKESINRDPNYALAYNNYGKALIDQGDYDGGMEKLKKAIERDPDLTIPYHNMAYILDKQNKPYDAIPMYLLVMKLNPKNADAYIDLGLLLDKDVNPPRPEEALEKLIEATNVEPESVRAHYTLGQVYLDKNDFCQAIPPLQKAINLYEKQKAFRQNDKEFLKIYAVAYNDLGWSFEQLKQYDSAITNYQKAINIYPGYCSFARLGWADTLRESGQFGQALDLYQNVIDNTEAKDPKHVEAHISKGRVFLERGSKGKPGVKRKDVEMAISIFNDVLKNIDSNSDAARKALEEAQSALNKL